MALNRVKLGCVLTFINYLASVIPLTFLPKTYNKTTFLASNSLNFAELKENEKYLQKNLPVFLFRIFQFIAASYEDFKSL